MTENDEGMATPVGLRPPTRAEAERDRLRVARERAWHGARADAERRTGAPATGPDHARAWRRAAIVGPVAAVLLVGAFLVVGAFRERAGDLDRLNAAVAEAERTPTPAAPVAPRQPGAATLPPPPTAPPTVEVVSADVLGRAYRDNEVAADRTYDGHRLLVVGKVGDIGKFLGTINVVLETSIGSANVNCSGLREYEDWVASLRKGQRVTIAGTCGGLSLGDVQLEDCRPVK